MCTPRVCVCVCGRGAGGGCGSCQRCFQRPPDQGSFPLASRSIYLLFNFPQALQCERRRTCNFSHPIEKLFLSFLKLRYTPCLFSKAPWGNEGAGRSLKRESAVSISRIKGPFPASTSVPSTEHRGRLLPAQGSCPPQPGTHSNRSPLGGWCGGRQRQPVVRSLRACPRLSPHFCDCNILMPRPPKQARTPEVGAGGVAGEVQGPGLHACGLPPIRSSLDKPRRASSFGNTAGHTPLSTRCSSALPAHASVTSGKNV